MEPPVAGPERDVGVRAESAVVVVAERVERCLRGTGAPRGEDDGSRTLVRNIHGLRTVAGASGRPFEQGRRLWLEEASTLQEFYVFGDQGRAGRLPEELRNASWWEAVADGAGYVPGTDQGEYQRYETLVFGQLERHSASRFEPSETERRTRDHPVQLFVGGNPRGADEGSGFRSGEGRRPQRTGEGYSLVS